MQIRKGDTVVVISGKDKGKVGTVLRAIPKANKVVVEGVNVQTKHAKATRTSASEIKHVDVLSMHQMLCSTKRRASRV